MMNTACNNLVDLNFFLSVVRNDKFFGLVSKKFLSFFIFRNKKFPLSLRPFKKIKFLHALHLQSKLNFNKFIFSFFNSSFTQFKNSKIWFFELELIGLGYRLTIKNNVIRLNLGFSHLIFTLLPVSVFVIKKKSKIMLFSLNKLDLSMLIARLLKFKPLNPYKLKGIKRKDLVFKLKPGKRTK